MQTPEEKLAGDYSADAREDAAHHFNVSEMKVTTILANHRRLERDYLEGDGGRWQYKLL